MKEVHELSLDLYEAKIGTYVRDIIPVEETNEIVRSERGGIPFPKPFSKWKSQNPKHFISFSTCFLLKSASLLLQYN